MAIRDRIPRPRSATAATRGRETPLVSGRVGEMLAEALADGLADAGALVFLSSLSVTPLLTGQTTETEIQVGRSLYGDR
jgi:hypothetical protein